MKSIIISSIIAIITGVVSLFFTTQASQDPLIQNLSFGLVPLIIGAATLILALVKDKIRSIAALFLLGLILIMIGDGVISKLMNILFGENNAFYMRDNNFVFYVLGIVSVFSSWILIIINRK